MKRTIFLATVMAGYAFGQPPAAPPKAHHLIGLENIKRNAAGTLDVQNGAMQFKGKTEVSVPVNTIEDIYIGTETTQSGGKAGTVVKTAAIAAPFHTGSALTLLLRTKVDMLTVTYHDQDGALHAAILSLPKGQADPMRARLIAAGAHASNLADQPSDKELKERKNQ
jgi:hypothetical protein